MTRPTRRSRRKLAATAPRHLPTTCYVLPTAYTTAAYGLLTAHPQ